MERFFFRTASERKRLEQIRFELARVSALISRYDPPKSGYNVPRYFEVGWIYYTASDGNIQDEKTMRAEYTEIQMLERVLYRQIKSLKEHESVKR